MVKAPILLAVCVAAASLIVGCGGGGSDDSTATVRVSKDQFVKQVSRFCKKTEQEKFKQIGVAFRAKAAAEPNWEPDEADLEETTLKIVLPLIEQVPQRMAEMTPPAGDEDKVDAIVEAFESDIATTKAEPQRFLESVAFSKGNKAAEAYGLNLCTF